MSVIFTTKDDQTKWRILLADPHALILDALQALLREEFTVIGTAMDRKRLLNCAARLKPDLVLVEPAMVNGLEAIKSLRRSQPATRAITVTKQTDRHHVQAAFGAGARGYVLKRCAKSELLTAMGVVMGGRFYVTPMVVDDTIARQINPEVNPSELFNAALTRRHRQVLQLIAKGLQAKAVADVLNISPKTVEYHRNTIMDHLGLRTTAELTRYAIQHGIVD